MSVYHAHFLEVRNTMLAYSKKNECRLKLTKVMTRLHAMPRPFGVLSRKTRMNFRENGVSRGKSQT